MRKVFALVAAIAAVFVLGLGAPVHAKRVGQNNQADILRLNQIDKGITAFSEAFGDETTSDTVLKFRAKSLSGTIGILEKTEFNKRLGKKYLEATEVVKQDALAIKKLADEAVASLDAGEAEKLDQSFVSKYNAAVDKYNKSVDALNKTIEEKNKQKGASYIWILVVTLLVSAGSMVWAFRGKESTRELTKARRAVAIASLWPLLGAAITAITFLFADKLGGRFFVMYGLVIVGAALFVRAIIAYVQLKSKTGPTPPVAPVA